MTTAPWMPLYVADYLADTLHLSTIQHGAYDLLIMHYWRHGGLPDDDRQLAAITKMRSGEWAKHRPIIAAFFQDRWRHKRIDAELKRTADVASAYASRARQAANARWSKHAPSNATGMHDECLSVPISQPQSQKEEDTANAVPSSSKTYAFESGIIRLSEKDFTQWKASYEHLDVGAELLGISEWAEQQGDRWFHATKALLAKRNREARAAAEKADKQPQFKYNGGMEGII